MKNLKEQEIKAVMDRYEIFYDDRNYNNFPCWRMSLSGNDHLVMVFCQGKAIDYYVETVAELETILKCLGIKRKPETFESEFPKFRDAGKMLEHAVNLHNKYLNKALDEIEKEVPLMCPSASIGIAIQCILDKIKELRPK